ncbi:hypothetical protein G7Z17_g1502 [Cylindrodendrum hubeiense]|uniref:Uncharacterized protein n=1 Tax=Cylindrodendrum hubeiense TaxID=595255 RepID=A0A9P5HEP2_9HYPO|nr:hypothetical protein G7Z17_g1502 [Cylindrodendrum hubeiense]
MDQWLSTVLNGQPFFSGLNHLLSEYNYRKLTYPEDALPGISGLLGVLSRSFEGGFLFGLPEICFDSALMWRANSMNSMKRRKDSGRTNLLNLTSRLPSWSWISWKCLGMTTIQEDTFRLWDRGYRTTPIVRWYTHETLDAAVKRPINSTWFYLPQKFQDSGFKLPEGWMREEYNKTQHGPEKYARGTPPDGLGKYVYRHVTDPEQYFWLPIPITTLSEAIELSIAPQTPYISCRTRRGWFKATKIPESEFLGINYAHLKRKFTPGLLNHQGKRCGWLHLHGMDDILQFPEDDSDVDFKVEIVAICRRKEEDIFARKIREEVEEKREGEIYIPVFKEMYCVLWVEWVAGVAYRKASGVVEKDVWEGYDTEVVDLILG